MHGRLQNIILINMPFMVMYTVRESVRTHLTVEEGTITG